MEIRYLNIVRVDDDAGFLFDSGWYHASTCSNRYGTEIAVGPDGVVSEVNPSGNEQSGNTFIPEGGYVLAAGEGSASERMLQNVSAGDRAEHVKETHLYTVRKMTVTEKTAGAKRPDNALLYLTSDSAAKTPAGSGTDVLVGPDGVILEVLPYSEGGRVIPEGGAAVCASGKYAYPLAEAAKVGELCILSGSKILCLIRNPQTVRNNCETRLAEAKERLAKAETDAAYVNVGQIETLLEQAENVLSETGENEAGRLLEALRLLNECETELIPSLPLGVRAAWVTIGERDANGQPYLHYRDGESVSRTVSYAKSLNINTLIIDNLATGYAVYPSSVPCLTPHPELSGFDVLQSFSDACLEAGIRLIVMFPALMSFDADATFPEDHYSRIYAGQILKTQTGRTSDGYGASALDPSEPAVRKLIADMVSEIALRYPSLSGIQADYIRYPLPVYYQESNYEDFGYSSPASESFRKERGTDPAALRITDALGEDWCACRRSVVTSLAAEISETARAVNPSLEMSFTCFADARDREIYVLQEPEIWAETGIADAVYPMIYANNTEDQLRYAASFSDISLHASVVLGVGAYVRATER
ncbi:MAG: family 10 glycosylhydrolase, partial [Clostridia bacterium]|nr:family 10 glycosylhydrolase [Clostridia bacterium]